MDLHTFLRKGKIPDRSHVVEVGVRITTMAKLSFIIRLQVRVSIRVRIRVRVKVIVRFSVRIWVGVGVVV